MKMTFLLTGLLFYTFENLNAQIQIENRSLTEPESKILIAGMDNEIVLKNIVEGVIYRIESSSSEISKLKEGSYILKPSYKVKKDTLFIYRNNELLKTDYFVVRPLPYPMVALDGIPTKTATVNQVLSSPGIVPVTSDIIANEMKVAFFNLTLIRDGDKIQQFEKTDSFVFSAAQMEAIKKLEPGDEVLIHKVGVTDRKGVSRILKGVSITIR